MIGYRISAGSVIGRSTAHGHSWCAPVTTDLLRKNVDSFYTLSSVPPPGCAALPPFLPSLPPTAARSLLRPVSSPFLFLCHPSPARPVWPPLRRSSTYRHRPQTASRAIDEGTVDRGGERERGNERRRKGEKQSRRERKKGTLVFFIGAVRRCLLVRSATVALSKKWLVHVPLIL